MDPAPPDMPRPWRQCRVLHLFAGRADRVDGVAACLRKAGIECDDVDIVNTWLADQDLLDDSTWQRWRARIRAGE